MMPLCNTVRWNTHCGAGYGMVYRFVCDPTRDLAARRPACAHLPVPRIGACAGRYRRIADLPAGDAHHRRLHASPGRGLLHQRDHPERRSGDGGQSAGQTCRSATLHPGAGSGDGRADGRGHRSGGGSRCRPELLSLRTLLGLEVAPRIAQTTRSPAPPTTIYEASAPLAGGEPRSRWPREIQKNLGLDPVESPFFEACERLIDPEVAEAELRRVLPPEQLNFTSDDYTEYCWHAPTVRFYVARPGAEGATGLCLPGLGDERG